MFANQLDLLELTSADAMPASVTVVPKDQTETAGIAEQFRVQFPTARNVNDSTYFSSRITGPGYRDPTCPPTGEHSDWPHGQLVDGTLNGGRTRISRVFTVSTLPVTKL
ncbi:MULTISPECIES: hypothetical protein [Amycolatopsis]|uniref:Uncharacterized protein n=1 Tax=Amycolatopsis albidoflavus TaxID=102226 RepID=A0ABW5HW51_9PSEU